MVQENSAIRLSAIVKQVEPVMKAHHKESELELIKQQLEKAQYGSVSLMVCGEFKRGKSTFINAFLGEDLCPTDVGIATSVISLIRYGKERKVVRFYSDGDMSNLKSEDISFSDIEKYAKGSALEIDNTIMLQIEIPSPKLQSGLVLIDTPGVGGLDPRHLYLTLYVMPQADVVLFVTDSSEPMSSTEMGFYAEKILAYSKQNLIILNKSDLKTKEEIDNIISDTKKKIEDNSGCEKTGIIPVSSVHWQMYNRNKSEKMKLSSNCEEVDNILCHVVPDYRKGLLCNVKDDLLQALSSILESLKFQSSQLQSPNEEELNLFKEKLNELKKAKDEVTNPNSELRKKVSSIIRKSQTKVLNELAHQSVLFSSECLDSLLKRPEAQGENGGSWLLEQINLGLESLAAEVDLKIDAGFCDVNDLLGGELDLSHSTFDKRIQVDLTPSERSLADKACGFARQSLPGVGILSITAGVLGLFAAPVVAGLAGLATASAYIYKSNKDVNTANRVMELKTKLSPQITIAMNDLKTYVQERFDEFNDSIVSNMETTTNSLMQEMQDIVEVLKACDEDRKEYARQQEMLSKQIGFIETHIKQTQLLLTNPFSK